MLEHRQNLDALGQQRAARRNQLTETRSALEQLPVSAAERLRSLRGELAAVEQRIAEINGRRADVIRAPIAGRVRWARPRTPGACSSASSPRGAFSRPSSLSRLAPSVSCVPGRRSGSLTKAFPYQHFGTYRGRIANVSQTILTDAEAAGPVRLNEPAYRVTASLERQDVDAAGERMPLQPDMLLRANIILDRRPLMAWIMGPLLAGTRGMHL